MATEINNNPNPKCSIISLGDNGNVLSDIPLSIAVYSYTFFYMLIFITDSPYFEFFVNHNKILLLSHVLQSMTEMYVDDIIAVCMDKDLASDLVTAKGVCTRLLGLMAVANDKTEWGIGWMSWDMS